MTNHLVELGDARIAYTDEGSGPPVLVLAPGGMRSAAHVWNRMDWNPLERLTDDFRVIAMDQRNAGNSSAPIDGETSWDEYRADQLALLDHLQIERCSLVGMCIGGPFITGLLRAAPQRFDRAVLLQPVGMEGNHQVFYELFDGWAEEISVNHQNVSAEQWASFRSNMWDGEFMLTATEADVASIETPMLVLMGDDVYHPQSTSRRLAAAAPNAELIEDWKGADLLDQTDSTIKGFLRSRSERPS